MSDRSGSILSSSIRLGIVDVEAGELIAVVLRW